MSLNRNFSKIKHALAATTLVSTFGLCSYVSEEPEITQAEALKRSHERSDAYLRAKGCEFKPGEIPFCPE